MGEPDRERVVRIALDENFPSPVLGCVKPYVFEAELLTLDDIDSGMRGLLDWQLVVALSRRGIDILASNDHRMIYEPKVLMAAHKTRTTLVLIDGLGHDAVRATGALLFDLPAVVRAFRPTKAKVFRPMRKAPQPMSPDYFMEERARKMGVSKKELIKREVMSKEDLQDPLGLTS